MVGRRLVRPAVGPGVALAEADRASVSCVRIARRVRREDVQPAGPGRA